MYLPNIAILDGAFPGSGFSTKSFTLYTLSSINFPFIMPYLSVSSSSTVCTPNIVVLYSSYVLIRHHPF